MELKQEGAVIPEWTLADRLRKARTHAGMEQTQLAAAIGIARSTITRYETGLGVPSRPVLVSWAICTNCDLGWLVGAGSINSLSSRAATLPCIFGLAA